MAMRTMSMPSSLGRGAGRLLRRCRMSPSLMAASRRRLMVLSIFCLHFKMGYSNVYVHPREGLIGRAVSWLVNNRRLAALRYAVMSRIGFLKMESDVTDVVYLTWLVDAEAARAFVAPDMRLWARNGKTLFTVLTYRHGHFGPAFLGRLRGIFPSPMQSNWRLYLDDGGSVYFLKNIMSSLPYVFGTRMFSDIMQTHLAAKFRHDGGGQRFELDIQSGGGSSPALSCKTSAAKEKQLMPAFCSMFDSWETAVAYIACQDTAISRAERFKRNVISEIDLPIDVRQVLPLDVADGSVNCSLLAQFPSAEGPFAFVVPRVKFRVLSERHHD